MATERKTLTQLSVPICLETLFYMLSGMVDTLMLSSVSDQAVGAVGTANTYIGVFIIMFGVISSGMIAVMSQNIGAGRPGIAYQARQLGLIFNALIGIVMSVILATFSGGILRIVSIAPALLATVYKGNIIKNLIMDCQSYTKYRPNETTGGIFVSWRRKEELPTGA